MCVYVLYVCVYVHVCAHVCVRISTLITCRSKLSAVLILTLCSPPSSPWHFENPSISFVSILSRSCSVLPCGTVWFPPTPPMGLLPGDP